MLNIIEMAAHLNVSVDTVRRRVRAGEIPAMKIGRQWRFDPERVVNALHQKSDPWARSPRSRSAKRAA